MLLKYNDAFVCNNKNLYDILKKKKKKLLLYSSYYIFWIWRKSSARIELQKLKKRKKKFSSFIPFRKMKIRHSHSTSVSTLHKYARLFSLGLCGCVQRKRFGSQTINARKFRAATVDYRLIIHRGPRQWLSVCTGAASARTRLESA